MSKTELIILWIIIGFVVLDILFTGVMAMILSKLLPSILKSLGIKDPFENWNPFGKRKEKKSNKDDPQK